MSVYKFQLSVTIGINSLTFLKIFYDIIEKNDTLNLINKDIFGFMQNTAYLFIYLFSIYVI